MKITPLALVVCFLCSGAAPLFMRGIDLMAMKKQEDERRKKLAKSKIAVNDTNVNSISVGNKKYGFVQMEPGEPLQEGETVILSETDKKTEEAKQPDFWKKQQTDLEERIAKLKDEIERGQSDLNKLWSDFYVKSVASEQEAIRIQISQLTTQIEQNKLFLGQAEAQLEDLSEKARKAGVPPGWLR
jgi:chromosome segregation ATPase